MCTILILAATHIVAWLRVNYNVVHLLCICCAHVIELFDGDILIIEPSHMDEREEVMNEIVSHCVKPVAGCVCMFFFFCERPRQRQTDKQTETEFKFSTLFFPPFFFKMVADAGSGGAKSGH